MPLGLCCWPEVSQAKCPVSRGDDRHTTGARRDRAGVAEEPDGGSPAPASMLTLRRLCRLRQMALAAMPALVPEARPRTVVEYDLPRFRVTETSAQLKLARGIKHVDRLRAEAILYEHSDAYVLDVKCTILSPTEVEYILTAAERQAPPPDWSLLAGEAVQNLRSALDHAVYALVKNRNRSRCQFPIFLDPCEFQVRGRPMIAGAPKPIQTLIEKTQPYQLMPTRPELHPLAFLNRLSNRDKHRVLNTVATAVQFQWIGLGDGIRIATIKPFSEGQALYNGAHVAHFVARSDMEIHERQVEPGSAMRYI
jgi:hypothetical protein